MKPQANVMKHYGRMYAAATHPDFARLLYRRRSRPFSLVSLVLLFAMVTAPAFAEDAAKEMAWPEATAQLANLRTTAEACVSVLSDERTWRGLMQKVS
jgi:hypothetical protein